MTTLGDLITSLRSRTDTVENEVVTDAECTAFLNASLAEQHGVLVTTYEDYNVTSAQFTITSSATPYFSLPSDFLKSRGVDRQVSGTWMTLYPFTMQQRNAWAYPFMAYPFGYLDVYYMIQDSKCRILPAQNAAATYQLWYVPQFSALSSPTDPLPTHMSTQAWSEYAVVDAAIKVLAKQDLDPVIFMTQKAELKQRIVDEASIRDAGPPKRMVNTRARWDRAGRHGRGGWGGF